MRREIDISRYFPDLMQEIKQFQGIREGENPQFRMLFEAMEQTLNRAFIDESDEAGIRRWERILNLASNGNLDVRKFRVLARMNEKLPYTMTILRNQLELLCDSDGYTVALNHEEYTLQVRLVFLVSEKLAAIREYLERTKPANILVKYGLWNPAIVLLQHQNFIFSNLGIKASFWNGFGSDSIRFNGSRRFDGSFLFDQTFKRVKFYHFKVSGRMKNYSSLSGTWTRNYPFFFDNQFVFDGTQTFSGGITKGDL